MAVGFWRIEQIGHDLQGIGSVKYPLKAKY